MLQKTSTITGQWTVVESNDKRYSRIKILKTVTETLEKELSVYERYTCSLVEYLSESSVTISLPDT